MNLNKVVTGSLNAFLKYLNAELLRVEDKQVEADDTGSTVGGTSDSEESVHISDGSSAEDEEIEENVVEG